MNVPKVAVLTARIASVGPVPEADAILTELETELGLAPAPEAPAPAQVDIATELRTMREAAVTQMARYRKIAALLETMESVHAESLRPQNAAVRPKVASAVAKIAGVFAEVDTVEDLDKPLEAIQKAISSLYGDTSKNSSYYFSRREKGGK